jgi:hypothetical protein
MSHMLAYEGGQVEEEEWQRRLEAEEGEGRFGGALCRPLIGPSTFVQHKMDSPGHHDNDTNPLPGLLQHKCTHTFTSSISNRFLPRTT